MIGLLDTKQLVLKIDDAISNTNEETVATSNLIGLTGGQLFLMNTSCSLHFSDSRQIFTEVYFFDLRQILLA